MLTQPNRHQGIMRQSRRGGWLVGCGVALAVVVLLVIGVGVFVAMNWRTWTADGMSSALTAAIAEMPIDDAEKAETQLVVDGFIERFRAGDVSAEQIVRVMQEIAESPVLPAGAAMGIGQAYLEKSDLTPEEKTDGRAQITRLSYGLADKSLSTEELRVILAPLRAAPSDAEVIQFDIHGENIRLKTPKNTTTEDLRAFIAQARTSADDNGLPETPPPFDLSGELDAAIKRAMGETAEPAGDDGAIPAPPAPVTPDPEP